MPGVGGRRESGARAGRRPVGRPPAHTAPGGLEGRNGRALVIDAARRIVAARGLHEVTIRAVAAGAGVSKAFVYRYFRDKNDLLEELAATLGDADTAVLRAPLWHGVDVAAFVRAVVAKDAAAPGRVRDHADLVACALRADDDREWIALGARAAYRLARRHVEDALAAPARRQARNGRARKDPRRPARAAVLLAALEGLAVQRLLDPDFDADGAYEALIALFGGDGSTGGAGSTGGVGSTGGAASTAGAGSTGAGASTGGGTSTGAGGSTRTGACTPKPNMSSNAMFIPTATTS
jgi:AcrR family transcriptional regulator